MFIEVVENREIIKRLRIEQGFLNIFEQEYFDAREQIIEAYLRELRILYPKASFQLAFESKIHLIEEQED